MSHFQEENEVEYQVSYGRDPFSSYFFLFNKKWIPIDMKAFLKKRLKTIKSTEISDVKNVLSLFSTEEFSFLFEEQERKGESILVYLSLLLISFLSQELFQGDVSRIEIVTSI